MTLVRQTTHPNPQDLLPEASLNGIKGPWLLDKKGYHFLSIIFTKSQIITPISWKFTMSSARLRPVSDSFTKIHMFIRAMHMNGDDDLRGSLAEDAEIQLYFQSTQSKHQSHTSSGNHGKVPHPEKPLTTTSSTTYKQRRKKPKHTMIYNLDSKLALQILYIESLLMKY